MSFDYSKLRGIIREKFGTQAKFAEAMDMSLTTLSAKLNNITEWGQSDILKAIELLDIPHEDITKYFFTLEVQ